MSLPWSSRSESDEEVSDDKSSQCESNGLLHAAKDASPVSSKPLYRLYSRYTMYPCIAFYTELTLSYSSSYIHLVLDNFFIYIYINQQIFWRLETAGGFKFRKIRTNYISLFFGSFGQFPPLACRESLAGNPKLVCIS